MTLVFPNVDTLRLARTSGIVPPAVILSPARFERRFDGSIALEPAMALPVAVVSTLRCLGMTVISGSIGGGNRANWLEALPLVRKTNAPIHDQTPILFELPVDEVPGL